MLKLVGTVRNGTRRISSGTSPWYTSSHQSIAACSDAATAPQSKVEASSVSSTPPDPPRKLPKSTNDIVRRALSKMEPKTEKLLSTVNKSYITYQQALDTVSALSEQVKQGKIDLKALEADNRYQKFCTIIARRSVERNKPRELIDQSLTIFSDTVRSRNIELNVRGFSIHRTIQVLLQLAAHKQRAKTVLHQVSENIINTKDTLTIKNIADILYCMARLSFIHEKLLMKLGSDLREIIPSVHQSAVIGSVLTSFGMMRYRDDELTELFCDWAIKHKNQLRPQDLATLLLTLAVIGYRPSNFELLNEALIVNLEETDMTKVSEWIDVVWSLVILDQATQKQMESVLSDKFVSQILDQDPAVSKQHKLLNINAAAKYLSNNYSGTLLKQDSPVMGAPIARMKDEENFVRAITDALANLFPSREHFRTNINVQCGFLIDAEFFVDKRLMTVPVHKPVEDSQTFRIAIVANYYHDYCVGKKELTGPVLLQMRILQAMGYQILEIPHSEFEIGDKLVTKISYINDRIKAIVK